MPPFILPLWYHFRIYQAQLSLFFVLGVVVAILLYPSRETGQPYAAEYVYSGFVYGEILLPPPSVGLPPASCCAILSWR